MNIRILVVVGGLVSCQASRLPDPDPLLFSRLDKNGSGTLEGTELAGLRDDEVRMLDRDRSGDVDPSELADYISRPSNNVLRMKAHQRGKTRRFKSAGGPPPGPQPRGNRPETDDGAPRPPPGAGDGPNDRPPMNGPSHPGPERAPPAPPAPVGPPQAG